MEQQNKPISDIREQPNDADWGKCVKCGSMRMVPLSGVCKLCEPLGKQVVPEPIQQYWDELIVARKKFDSDPAARAEVSSVTEQRTDEECMRIARSKWWDGAWDKPANVFGAFEAGYRAAKLEAP